MLRKLGGVSIPGVTRGLASRCAASGQTAVGQKLPSVVNYRAATARERTVMGDSLARGLATQRSSMHMSSVDPSLTGGVEERSGIESQADGNAGNQNEDGETPTWEGLTEEEAQAAVRPIFTRLVAYSVLYTIAACIAVHISRYMLTCFSQL